MQQFEHEGILYEELPNGQARVIGPAGGAGPVYGSPKAPPPPPAGYQSVPGGLRPIPGGPADKPEKPEKPTPIPGYDGWFMGPDGKPFRPKELPEKKGGGNPIPVGAAKDLETKISAFNDLQRAVSGFNRDYSGAGAGLESMAQGLLPVGTPGQRDWWADFKRTDTITRNILFGSSLTDSEKASYAETTVTPNMRPEEIQRNLERRLQLARDVLARQKDFLLANGYKEEAVNALLGGTNLTAPPINDQTKAGFDLQQDPSIASMTPEQTAAYQAWWKANPNPTPAQLNQFFVAVGLGPAPNAQEIIAAAKEGRGISTTIENQIPQRIQERLDQRLENTGAGGAAVAGGADTITMGTFDELSALGDAVGDAFQGQGFDYSGNLAANRQFQEGLQDQHGGAYLGGQIAGGLVLPTFGASTPAQLAKVGAGYGAAYGAGSGEGMGRLGGAALGATAGAAIGGTLGKASQFVAGRRQPREVPPLVGEDGRLNEPLEALRPGQRVAAAREFGIDLPLGAATDRGGALLEKGLDILPGSAGAMNDARRVTERQVSGAVEQVAGRFGASKTLNEAGGEAQRGAREWMGRFEATASKAYDAIPISPKAQASVQATVGTIDNILARFSSNPELAAQMNSPKLQQMREAIAKGLSWEDLKALRSRIGYEIGEQRFSDSPTKDDLRAVYAALSEDMKATAAAMGPRATQAFNRANSFYRQGQQRIDQALVTLLGNDGAKSPEAAAKAIQAMTQGGKGTGDLAKLAQVRAATIKSGAWDEIAGALIRIGGQPADSPGRTFSPETFVRWYADMAEPARKMLFKPELRKSLDQFVAVNQRLAGTNALRNTSNTAPGLLAGGVMGTMGVAALNPLLGAKLLGGMAANFGMAKVWTNPRFVQWATGYTKAVASGNERAVKQQIGRLSKLGTTNPELRGVIETIVRNSANDNVGPRLAADSVGDDQQGR